MAVNAASQASLRHVSPPRWPESAGLHLAATFSLSPPLRPVAVEFLNRRNNRDNSPSPARRPFISPKIKLLGIRPAREDPVRDPTARKANCVEFPFSRRTIKKNRRYQQRCHEREGSISRVFACTVFVVLELRSYALRLRGSMAENVQTEMNSSFAWLFREVFSRTPDLMLDLMILVVDFAAHSAKKEKDQRGEETAIDEEKLWALMVEDASRMQGPFPRILRLIHSSVQLFVSPVMLDLMILVVNFVAHSTKKEKDQRGEETAIDEEKLWALMVEEASRMQGPFPRILRLIHSSVQLFVSPVSVEIEEDDYEEYDRRDLIYQIAIYEEARNPLWFFNYGQFLYLVRRDFDRAEECFLRAIELDPNDAEVLSQYATFLWMARRDPWAAEERYQQAMAAEPANVHCASRYACFLWITDGEGYLKEFIDN